MDTKTQTNLSNEFEQLKKIREEIRDECIIPEKIQVPLNNIFIHEYKRTVPIEDNDNIIENTIDPTLKYIAMDIDKPMATLIIIPTEDGNTNIYMSYSKFVNICKDCQYHYLNCTHTNNMDPIRIDEYIRIIEGNNSYLIYKNNILLDRFRHVKNEKDDIFTLRIYSCKVNGCTIGKNYKVDGETIECCLFCDDCANDIDMEEWWKRVEFIVFNSTHIMNQVYDIIFKYYHEMTKCMTILIEIIIHVHNRFNITYAPPVHKDLNKYKGNDIEIYRVLYKTLPIYVSGLKISLIVYSKNYNPDKDQSIVELMENYNFIDDDYLEKLNSFLALISESGKKMKNKLHIKC